jgi:hypothetical protein
MRFPRCFILAPALACMVAMAGCSDRQIYQSAAGWRINECQKILEDAARARCLESANKDYDTYKKQRDSTPDKK